MMKLKPIATAIVALALVCLLVTSTSMVVLAQDQQEEEEPNDALGTANPVQRSQITGELSPAGDEDWFAIDVEAGETISGTLTITQSADTTSAVYVEIVAPNGTELAKESAGYSDHQVGESITAQQSGTYYIVVYATFQNDNSIPYSLTVTPVEEVSTPTQTQTQTVTIDQTTTPPPEETPTPTEASPETTTDEPTTSTGTPQVQEETEPNDALGTANPVQRSQITGELSPAGDEDWFAIDVEAGETISGALTITQSADTTSAVYVEIVAPNGTELAKESAGYSDHRVGESITAQQSGTYYIVVYATFQNDNNIPYSLTVTPVEEVSTPTQTQTQTVTIDQTTATTATTATTTKAEPSPTTMPAPTSPQTNESRTANGTTQSGGGDSDNTASAFGPGFGVVGAVIALLAIALLAIRQ